MTYRIMMPVLALACVGCQTHLDAVVDSAATPPVGVPYQLPRTVVAASNVWTLDKCPIATVTIDETGAVRDVVDGDDNKLRVVGAAGNTLVLTSVGRLPTIAEIQNWSGEAEFKPTSSFTTETIGGETYSIDYEQLTNGTKTGSLKVEYHEGTLLLKSINAKVEGKEAEALKSAFSLAGNAARIALGLPSAKTSTAEGNLAQTTKLTFTPCNEATHELLTEKAKLSEDIKKIEIDAARVKAEVTLLSARVANGVLAAPGLLNRLETDALRLQRRLEANKAALATINQWLSVDGTVKLPGGDATNPTYTMTLVPTDKKIAALRDRIASEQCDPTGCLGLAKLKKDFEVTAMLATLTGGTGCEGNSDGNCATPQRIVPDGGRQTDNKYKRRQRAKAQDRTGLIIRQPVEARLTLTSPTMAKPVLDKRLPVAQFGVRRTLPLRNGFAESNSLSVTFDKAGMPTMIEYTKPRSGTVEFFDALDEGAQMVLALQADRRAADKADTDAEVASAKSELEALQRQRDLLKVQAEIDEIQRATPAEIEALQADIATLELLKQIAELKKAIAAATPPVP